MKYSVKQLILKIPGQTGPVGTNKFQARKHERFFSRFGFPGFGHHADVSFLGAFTASPEGGDKQFNEIPFKLDLQV